MLSDMENIESVVNAYGSLGDKDCLDRIKKKLAESQKTTTSKKSTPLCAYPTCSKEATHLPRCDEHFGKR